MSNIKAYTSENRLHIGRIAGCVGLFVNLALFGLKLYASLRSGSVSVAADAVNNLSDALSSVFVIVGYVMASKPADAKHPFGHARMEYLCGLFISVAVTVLGIEMLRSSVTSIFEAKAASHSRISVVIMCIGIAAKLGLALFYTVLGRRIDSQSLRASATDSIGDICATAAVIVGIVLTPYTGASTDGILGTAIAIYIIVLGIRLVLEASGTLLGEAPDAGLVDDMISAISAYDGVLGVHDLVIHSYGAGRIFASVHVEMDSSLNPMTSHDTIDRIEAEFLQERGISLVIHMDPVCLSDAETNSLRVTVSQILEDVCEECGVSASMHDFRVMDTGDSINIIFDVAVKDTTDMDDAALSSKLACKIGALDPRYNTVITIDRDYTAKRFGDEIK